MKKIKEYLTKAVKEYRRLLKSRIKGGFIKILEVIIIICFGITSLGLIGCATTSGNLSTKIDAKMDQTSFEERWGIKIIGIRQTAAGYMLDFRYRVIDPEKAAPLFNRKTKPYLIDQASGAKFAVPNPPKTGPIRTSDLPEADRNYFIFFANPGKYVKLGNKVTVVIGDFRAENLTVE